MSKKLLNISFSLSLSKLILKSPAITISLLQFFSKLDIIGVNSSIKALRSSFRILGDRYIFPIVTVFDKLLCTFTTRPFHCWYVLRLHITFDLYWSSIYIINPLPTYKRSSLTGRWVCPKWRPLEGCIFVSQGCLPSTLVLADPIREVQNLVESNCFIDFANRDRVTRENSTNTSPSVERGETFLGIPV